MKNKILYLFDLDGVIIDSKKKYENIVEFSEQKVCFKYLI